MSNRTPQPSTSIPSKYKPRQPSEEDMHRVLRRFAGEAGTERSGDGFECAAYTRGYIREYRTEWSGGTKYTLWKLTDAGRAELARMEIATTPTNGPAAGEVTRDPAIVPPTPLVARQMGNVTQTAKCTALAIVPPVVRALVPAGFWTPRPWCATCGDAMRFDAQTGGYDKTWCGVCHPVPVFETVPF